MARTRIQGASVSLEVAFPEIFSAAERSKAFAEYAREQIGHANQVNAAVLGRPAPYATIVDGRRGGSLDSVRPDGQIVAEWDLISPTIEYVREQLIKHSPVGRAGDRRPGHPGLYRSSHVLIIDGRPQEDGAPLPPLFEEAVFASTVPYARKIENGLSSQAPDGVYEAVAMLAQRRFGNVARIGFSWRSLLIGGIDEWARSPGGRRQKARRGGRPGLAEDWLRRQPSVVVRPR
ncbi:hypothetical protein [Enterovirga rhinocerotis]|uniref:Uncharacterized protein n=1 Tax=Enterovirga rhinocerotis TaxID=1339210 RepID=A0A4R7C1N2_9HYPH|nr:hypothetical protein [Enterovirga rhinocerotis]TDR90296.1 hypothetical protein EV668_3142 [Enterovirga rhinocerotis]